MTMSRDFQWTQHEKQPMTRPVPPPLPSLPPWANSQAISAPMASDQPQGGTQTTWHRPTSYFGSMKRLPPSQSSYNHHLHSVVSQQEEERSEFSGTMSQAPQHKSNQDQEESFAHETSEYQSASYFRPWRKNKNIVDGDGDGKGNNKWKGRALLNPFAKAQRKAPQVEADSEEEPIQQPLQPLQPLVPHVETNITRSIRPVVRAKDPSPHLCTDEDVAQRKALEQAALVRKSLSVPTIQPDDPVVRLLHEIPTTKQTPLEHLPILKAKKKVSTLEALHAIQQKRQARRQGQLEEKERISSELQAHGDDTGYKFRRLVQLYHSKLVSSQKLPIRLYDSNHSSSFDPTTRLRVYVRKRPLDKKELKAKGYDVVTCCYTSPSVASQVPTELICHEPKYKVDCSETLEHHSFLFDGVFDENQGNTAVYQTTVGPLLPSLVEAATTNATTVASLTVFAYGQTGSGKTYTMKSIYRQAASDLFQRLGDCADIHVGISFYEIYMNHVNDLLNQRTRLQLLEDGDGMVQLLGLQEVIIRDVDGLMGLIDKGEASRATSANAVHDQSSRSHALLRITLYHATTSAVLARLSLVDLAGSERACDTQSDRKNTRMEGAEINKSLLALKECIRALDRNATHIPFRQSKLTQLLRDSFLLSHSKTVMLATVSPCSESCNHTLNTLRYADRLKEIGTTSHPN